MRIIRKKAVMLILLLLACIGFAIICFKESRPKRFELLINFEETPIYASDLKNIGVLSDKLSKGLNYALLIYDMESVKDVDVFFVEAVLFDFCDMKEKYRRNTVYYFDHRALYDSVANKFGISTEELIEINELPELENNIVEYHISDGDNFRGYVKAIEVEWLDEAKVEVCYELYDGADYHLWDGKVTLQEKDGNMIFVSNKTRVKE